MIVLTFCVQLLNFYTNDPEYPWYFPDIWDNPKLTCEDKVALQYPVNGQFGTPVNGTDLKLTFSDSKEITWFWTISDCQLHEGQYLQVKLCEIPKYSCSDFICSQMHAQMDWENPGSWWYKEFSVEDQNLLTIYLIFSVFWLVLTFVASGCVFFFFIRENRELDWVYTTIALTQQRLTCFCRIYSCLCSLCPSFVCLQYFM